MIIHEIHDISNSKVINLLRSEFSKITEHNIIQNYHPEYENKPGNIFTLLKSEGRYSSGKGKYYIIEENNQYICSAGWNSYPLLPDTALLLSRMYVSKNNRARYMVGKYILPLAINEASKNHTRLWMTFNTHNNKLQRWFEMSKYTPELYRQFKFLDIDNIYGVQQYIYQFNL